MLSKALATFKNGGVHPKENKNLTQHLAIETMPSPAEVSLYLKQHIGVPCKAIVKKKDKVVAGDLVGTVEDRLGAELHTGISGTIKGIKQVLHPSEGKVPAIIITSDPEAEPTSYSPVDWSTFSRDKLLDRIKAAGIVGLGGAGFPANVKLNFNPKAKVDTLIINGAECEPYLTCDHRIMLEHPREIIESVKILLTIMRVKDCVIGIENNKPDAIEALNELISQDKSNHRFKIVVKPLAVKYPQGAADQIMESVTGRLRPAGVRSSDIGIIVQNVYTTKIIYDAVVLGKPFFERVITITGNAIARPANLLVKVGTSLSDIVEFLGGTTPDLAKVVVGGPMMGVAVSSLDIPIEKTTSGVVFLAKGEASTDDYGPCIRCGFCVEACPMGLEPNNIGIYVEAGRGAECEQFNLEKLCFDCGSCAYVCPAKRPLVQFSRLARIKISEAKKKNK